MQDVSSCGCFLSHTMMNYFHYSCCRDTFTICLLREPLSWLQYQTNIPFKLYSPKQLSLKYQTTTVHSRAIPITTTILNNVLVNNSRDECKFILDIVRLRADPQDGKLIARKIYRFTSHERGHPNDVFV